MELFGKADKNDGKASQNVSSVGRAQVVYISGILTRTHYGASRLFQRLFYEEGQNGDQASKLISQSI